MKEVITNLPMPPTPHTSSKKYPWKELRIGDCFAYDRSLQSAKAQAYTRGRITQGTMDEHEYRAAELADGKVYIWRVR